jgi:hypothetical protein
MRPGMIISYSVQPPLGRWPVAPARGISCAAHIRPTAPAHRLPRTVNCPLPPPLTPPNEHRLLPKRPPFARPWDALATGEGKLGTGLAVRGQQLDHAVTVAPEGRPWGHFTGQDRGVNLGQEPGGQGSGIDRPGATVAGRNRANRRGSRAKRPTANVAHPGFGSCVVVNHGT